ncbi:hypothetical protein D3C85_1380820 [compost metagenome]
MQRQITGWRTIHRRFGVRANAVHALGVRQVLIPWLAGDGEGDLAVELRNDRTERLQGSYNIVGKFPGGKHRPALRRQLFMTMVQ